MTPNPDDFDLEVETPDPSQAPTHIYVAPARPYRLLAGSMIVTSMLIAVLAWSMRRAESRPTTPTPVVPTPPVTASATPAASPNSTSTSASTSGAVERSPPPVAPARVIEPAKPRRIAALLSLSLTELRTGSSLHSGPPATSLQPVRLADMLGDGTTVVNLWATYCGPCLRELPAFRELARRDRWGREVRFVPVMVDQLRPEDPAQTAALTQLREVTTNLRMLIDPADELNRSLRATGVHEGPAVLPVTLIFHCDELAWAQLGEIDPALLAQAVQRLRRLPRCEAPERPAELSTIAAPTGTTTAPPVPSTPTPSTSAHRSCGDGRCDRTLAETCANCRADCGCPSGTSCTLNAARATYCARDETALKD